MPRLTQASSQLVARRFAALSDPTRLRLLDLMHERGELAVGELAEEAGTTYPNASKHLAILLGERMVSRRRGGARALDRLADPTLMQICDEVCAGIRDELEELVSAIDPPRGTRA